MSWEPRPTPTVTPETELYWSAAANDQLLVCECADCSLIYHYPRKLCPDCFSDNINWKESDGTGNIYSYSTAYTMSGWPEENLPLVVAYVELDEGPRMITNIECDPEEIEVGTRVEVHFVDFKEDIAIPIFVPLTD